MRVYPSFDDAVLDALRLARAMTYKAALAGMSYGGGKAVILGDPARDKSRSLLAAYARAVDRLGGRFQTGCDMGIDAPRRDGDGAAQPALRPHAGRRAARHRRPRRPRRLLRDRGRRVRPRPEVGSLHVAVQGVGQVGMHLARALARAGARVTVCDVDPARVERAAAELGASAVDAEAIYDVEADVFSPNAAGGILNGATIPRLRVAAVVGAANDQLADAGDGDRLHARGILYGPDYLVNAGGLLSVLFEKGETDEDGVVERIRDIRHRLLALWDRARAVVCRRIAWRTGWRRSVSPRAAHGGIDEGNGGGHEPRLRRPRRRCRRWCSCTRSPSTSPCGTRR